jgi:hypothetical protein
MPTSSPSTGSDFPIIPRAQGGSGRSTIRTKELSVTFGFRCNLACTVCLVEDAVNAYQGVDLRTLERLLKDGRITAGVTTIILSGAEVTVEPDLEKYVALCRATPGIEHVRLQTNAVRLADRAYLDHLIALGVDEYFVSLHGATASVCDGITGRTGSFEQIVLGMRNIAERGATLMTNTVIIEANYRELPDIAKLVAPLRPKSIDFWGYLPRFDHTDARGLLARVSDVVPVLRTVLDDLDERRPESPTVTVKHLPRCLLGRHSERQNDSQPTVLIDDSVWDRYPPCACIYDGVCSESGNNKCRGLPFAYVRRFGWEEDLLRPFRAEGARRPGNYWGWARRGAAGDESPADLLQPGGWDGFPLIRVTASSDRLRLAFEVDRAEVWVDLLERRPGRRCFVRSKSVDLTYSISFQSDSSRGLSEELKSKARALLERIGARVAGLDDGRLWAFIAAHISRQPHRH